MSLQEPYINLRRIPVSHVPASGVLGVPRATRRLRVVHAIYGFDIGGTELNVIRTLERLDRNYFATEVISFHDDGPLRKRYSDAGVPVHYVSVPNFHSISAIRGALRLMTWMRKTRPDIVHCHDRYTNVFVAPCARAAGVPVVITSRRWWTAMPRAGYAIANKLAYKLSDIVIANSPAVSSLLVQTEGIDANKVRIIPNFLDDDDFVLCDARRRAEWRETLGIPSSAVVGTVVARFRPEKNIKCLLRAAAQLALGCPELHLLLVGSGPCEAALRAAAKDLGISARVHFAGLLSDRPNPHQLGEFSVLCSSHEAFPNSVLEAMAAGRPVIGTRVGGIPDAVEHGSTGLLVTPNAPDELAAAIDLLVSDARLRERLGLSGRERARSQYNARAVLGQLANVYVGAAEEHAANSMLPVE